VKIVAVKNHVPARTMTSNPIKRGTIEAEIDAQAVVRVRTAAETIETTTMAITATAIVGIPIARMAATNQTLGVPAGAVVGAVDDVSRSRPMSHLR
jgi:hypothetical protein